MNADACLVYRQKIHFTQMQLTTYASLAIQQRHIDTKDTHQAICHVLTSCRFAIGGPSVTALSVSRGDTLSRQNPPEDPPIHPRDGRQQVAKVGRRLPSNFIPVRRTKYHLARCNQLLQCPPTSEPATVFELPVRDIFQVCKAERSIAVPDKHGVDCL